MPGWDNDCAFFGHGIDTRGLDYTVNPVVNQMDTDGKILIAATAFPYIRANTLTPPGSGITITGGPGTITFALSDDLAAIEGLAGSGVASRTGASAWTTSSITQNAVIVGGAGQTLSNIGPLTNGQLVIGSTGVVPVAASLTAGTGVTITNGAGTISIAVSSGGIAWTDATNATYNLSSQNGYVTNRGGGVTYTLPATAALGDVITIIGKAGLATIAQNAGQQICFGNDASTVGVGGSIVATDAGDCVSLRCITAGANTVWRVENSMGNWTIN